MTRATALLLCLSATGLAAEEPASAKRQLDESAGFAVQVPAVGPASEVEIPEDIREAGARWGTEAQKAKLAAARPQPKASFRFAVIGDAEPGRFFFQKWWNPGKDAYKRHLAKIHAQNPDLIFQLGDFVSKGTLKNYRAYIKLMDKLVALPVFHVIGNHDRSAPNGPADKTFYHSLFGDGDYSLDHNGWRFVAIDSSDYALTDAQLDWLDRTLETDKPCLVFTHIVPEYLKGKLESVYPDKSIREKLVPRAYFSAGSARFGEIVRRRAVRRVYLGHIHALGKGELDGVRYALSGGGGSPLYPLPPGYPKSKPAHYLLVDVSPSGLSETVYSLDGAVYPLGF